MHACEQIKRNEEREQKKRRHGRRRRYKRRRVEAESVYRVYADK